MITLQYSVVPYIYTVLYMEGQEPQSLCTQVEVLKSTCTVLSTIGLEVQDQR
jgi:hypothetical protein